jgi:hypothetical protein
MHLAEGLRGMTDEKGFYPFDRFLFIKDILFVGNGNLHGIIEIPAQFRGIACTERLGDISEGLGESTCHRQGDHKRKYELHRFKVLDCLADCRIRYCKVFLATAITKLLKAIRFMGIILFFNTQMSAIVTIKYVKVFLARLLI